MSTFSRSVSYSEYSEYSNCHQCGRQYSKSVPATHRQYYCSTCGEEIEQEEISPLIIPRKIPNPQNFSKYVRVMIASLLLLATLAIAYFMMLDPDASDARVRQQTETNTTAPSVLPTMQPFTLPPTLDSAAPLMLNHIINSTLSPIVAPVLHPTWSLTLNPTTSPTKTPTVKPTKLPTKGPIINPTRTPTINPTPFPTKPPSKSPSKWPTISLTIGPTLEPTTLPTRAPTATNYPSLSPTVLELTTEWTGEISASSTDAWIVGGVGLGLILIIACIFCFFKCKKARYNDKMINMGTARISRAEIGQNYAQMEMDDKQSVKKVGV
eukprot:23357_1